MQERKPGFIRLPSDDILSAREVVGISHLFQMSEDGFIYGFEIYLISGHTYLQRGSREIMETLRDSLLTEVAAILNFTVVDL